MIQLNITDEQIERANQVLAGIPGAAVRAISTTLNKAIDGARVDAAREAVKIYHVTVSNVKKAIMVSRSRPGASPVASFKAKGYRRAITEYRLTPSSPKSGGKYEVYAAVKREGGMKPLPKAYIARSDTGYGAYIGAQRLTSPAIPQLINNPEVIQAVEGKSVERVEKALDHEILRLLGAFK